LVNVFYLPPEGQGPVLVSIAFYGLVVLMARVVSVIITRRLATGLTIYTAAGAGGCL